MAELDKSREYGIIFGINDEDDAVFTQDGKRFNAAGQEATPIGAPAAEAVVETPAKKSKVKTTEEPSELL